MDNTDCIDHAALYAGYAGLCCHLIAEDFIVNKRRNATDIWIN